MSRIRQVAPRMAQEIHQPPKGRFQRGRLQTWQEPHRRPRPLAPQRRPTWRSSRSKLRSRSRSRCSFDRSHRLVAWVPVELVVVEWSDEPGIVVVVVVLMNIPQSRVIILCACRGLGVLG